MDGFFIAKIEVKKIDNEAFGIVYKNAINRSSSAIIFNKLSDLQLLKVILIKSENILSSEKKLDFEPKNLFYQKTFSESELNNYLIVSGDKNSIHYVENAVIPGVLILQNFLENCTIEPEYFTVKFHNPLHLQKELTIYKITDNEAVGLCESKLIFQIKINNI